MISLRNFALRRGERLLLSNVDLTMHAGYRVGVVGRNGSGKSSLFAAIRTRSKRTRAISTCRQGAHRQRGPGNPVAAGPGDRVRASGGDEVVAAVLREEAEATAREDWEAVAAAHQKMAEWAATTPRRARESYCMAWVSGRDPPCEVSEFSGGWRVRLNLARALMMPSGPAAARRAYQPFGLDAVLWLEQWLLKYPGTLTADLARPRIPRRRRHAHPAPEWRRRQALRRRLYRFRTPAHRATAPAADRA